MISRAWPKWFMTLWYTVCGMGWMIFGEKSIEKAVEFAFANVTDIADFNGRGVLSRFWFPQGVAESRMCDCKLKAKGVIVCH
jgi:hypothetical protein